MTKKFVALSAVVALMAGGAATAVPMTASAQAQSNGITNCDAPGGRQRAGAAIGAVIGGLAGSQVSRNERGIGAAVGAAGGAAVGSYIGCNQQRTRADQAEVGGAYRATANLKIRTGPGTSYRQTGSLSAGQPFTIINSQGDWVQIAGGGWVSARYVAQN